MKKPTLSTAEASISQRIFAAAGILTIAGGSFVVGYFNPSSAGFFPVCPLYRLTGIACPGCGLTRGFHALLNGDVLTALDYNAMLPIYLFILSYLLVSLVLTTARGRGLSWKIFPPTVMYGFLIIAIAFAILRNLPVYPFTFLAP